MRFILPIICLIGFYSIIILWLLPYMFLHSFIKLLDYLYTSVYFISIKYGFGMNDIENYGLKKYFISFVENRVKININSKENESKLKVYKEAENYIKIEKEKIEEDNESKLKEFKGEGDFIIIEKEKNEEEKTNDNEKKEEFKNENNEEEKKENERKIIEIINLAENFFEKIMLYIGPIQVLIKARELSVEIFDFFES